MIDTSVEPIWIEENSDHPYNNISFETEFTLDYEIDSAYIDLFAPEHANIFINRTRVGDTININFDSFPAKKTPIRIEIPSEILKEGKNILRIEIQNNSHFRGMMAEINFNLSNTGE